VPFSTHLIEDCSTPVDCTTKQSHGQSPDTSQNGLYTRPGVTRVSSSCLTSILPCPAFFYPGSLRNQTTLFLECKPMTLHATKSKMPLDIFPLCLYHDLRMIPTQETRHPRRFLEETYYYFSCSVPGCNQHYDMEHGYYAIVKGKREEGANKLPCPDCSNRLYLVTRGALNEATVWRCANEACPSNGS
jgi:hypothetical protein